MKLVEEPLALKPSIQSYLHRIDYKPMQISTMTLRNANNF